MTFWRNVLPNMLLHGQNTVLVVSTSPQNFYQCYCNYLFVNDNYQVLIIMIKCKLLKNNVLVNNQSLAVTKSESFYRTVKGCQTAARFFFIHKSCFGNIRRGSFILEAEKHIKPICFRNF